MNRKPPESGCSIDFFCAALKALAKIYGHRLTGKESNAFVDLMGQLERDYHSLPPIPPKERKKKAKTS